MSLEVVTEQALVPPTVALALGLSPGDDPFASIVGELAPYGPLVLVLDGCEAALDGAATLAGELVVRCPQLTLLATTRLPLGLQDEVVVHLAPWPVPDPDADEPPGGPALDLLLARAGDEAPSVARADRAILGSLLRHCGGIPLAIELVAAQLATMAAGDLADRLDQLLRGDDDPVRGRGEQQLRAAVGGGGDGLPALLGAGRERRPGRGHARARRRSGDRRSRRPDPRPAGRPGPAPRRPRCGALALEPGRRAAPLRPGAAG